MNEFKLDGYPIVCYGAQTVYLKRIVCDGCDFFCRQKYPPTTDCWRLGFGYINKKKECNIRKILKI